MEKQILFELMDRASINSILALKDAVETGSIHQENLATSIFKILLIKIGTKEALPLLKLFADIPLGETPKENTIAYQLSLWISEYLETH